MIGMDGDTHKSFWSVRSCGYGLLELVSGAPITLSCSRRLLFLDFSDACLVAETSLLVIVDKQSVEAATK